MKIMHFLQRTLYPAFLIGMLIFLLRFLRGLYRERDEMIEQHRKDIKNRWGKDQQSQGKKDNSPGQNN